MSSPFEVLPKDTIRRWLNGLIEHGASGHREGPTLHAIAKHTGIPRNSLLYLALVPGSGMSNERQRLFSKLIAQIDNGQLVFERDPVTREKRAVFSLTPRPRVRYAVEFSADGPRLRLVDRPRAVRRMPTVKELLVE